ncbi:MAG: flagellar transcriptional regulator FlhD [Pseudomonadota bacterium]
MLLMTTPELMSSIRDTNLAYLILAQQMLRQDRATAIYRFGISRELADLIDSLSPAQIVRLASSNVLLMRLRLDTTVAGILGDLSKDRTLVQAHASILFAAQPVEPAEQLNKTAR